MYSTIDADDKNHLLILIDWLYNEVARAGGDGDGIWYSRYYDVKDLREIILEFNKTKKFGWNVSGINDGGFFVGEGQEGFLITDNEKRYNESPGWTQVKIRY